MSETVATDEAAKKQSLREELTARRKAMTPDLIDGRGLKVQSRFLASPYYQKARTVALYAPVPQEGWTPLGFVACAFVFTPLLFDTAYTLVRRLRTGAGKNIFSAHREHIYQRITPTTGMHRRTSNLYYGASVITGFAALLVERSGTWMLAGIALALACCALLAALPRLMK